MENDLNSHNRVSATRTILINFFFELLTLVIMASKLNKISSQYILFIPNANPEIFWKIKIERKCSFV